ncbi:transcription initiation factor IID, 18kD subunit-domain-containing protein [Armillaria borealis]|uniref:Transcription initiation factor TFIID subunit 13 n=1 Tax=Armillaria borealis TaxID=47425 RepID=A0AA39JY63_9AGAR|nr:transcription initiation factor IID, 18kD subunit-domain-containing protein [Armillaria borealis]
MSYYAQPTSATYPYGAYAQTPYAYQSPAGYQPWSYHQYPYVHPAPTPTPTVPRSTTFQPYTPSYARDNTASTSTGAGRGSRKQSNMKGLFTKELKNLMYGFGDDRNPANDTVNVMEEILIEYITDVCLAAGGSAKKGRLSVDDLRRVLSRPADSKKLARMEELLFMQEDIKRARAQFDDADNPRGL